MHKETIAVAIAGSAGGAVRYQGEIPNTPAAVRRLSERLGRNGSALRFCYEAGPCGYDVYRQLIAAGHACAVVAPALIPRKPGDRIKTDRRDAISLARLDRADELTAVWVPGPEQEAMRDLSRAREGMRIVDRQLRQRLSGFLLRHGRRYPGKQAWSQPYWRWFEPPESGGAGADPTRKSARFGRCTRRWARAANTVSPSSGVTRIPLKP